MAELNLIEQLNLAVQALLVRPEAHPAPPSPESDEVAALAAIAADLRLMPSPQFHQRLRADLQWRAQMASTAIAVPATTPAMAPYLCVRNAAAALDFYKRAFGATELLRLTQPDGKIAHAEIQVAGAVIMLADELPQYGFISPQTLGGAPLKIYLYFDDVDAAVPQAVAAGATLARPIADEFYGERSGQITDPFGFTWILSTRKEILTAQEITRRFDALMQQQQPVPKATQREPAKVREGFHTVTPYLIAGRPEEFLAFMKQAFGAEETFRAPGSAGGMHVELRIGDSMVMAGGGAPVGVPATPSAIHLYVTDADAVYRRAVAAGATSFYEPMDMPYGDREAGIKDGFGNSWYIATHKATGHLREGLRAVTPTLHPRGADSLLDFLKRGLAAQEEICERSPDGTVMHAAVRIGDSVIEIGEARGPIEPTASMLLLYVPDVDAAYHRAVAAGSASLETPADQPYGERRAGVQDSHGNSWFFSAPIASPKQRADNLSASQRIQPEGKQSMTVSLRAGFHTVTPYIAVREAPELIDFVTHAFGAQELLRTGPGSEGGLHAEVRIGDSVVMIGGGAEWRGSSPLTAVLHLYVSDTDAAYQRALDAGATSLFEPIDRPYGERQAGVRDVAGNTWYIATHAATGHTPKGLRSLTPYFHPRGADTMLEFMKDAFAAEETQCERAEDGSIRHAKVRIGDSVVEIGEAQGEWQPGPCMMFLYVDDVDAWYRRAVEAGGASISEPAAQPYGDRVAAIRDPHGNSWYMATPVTKSS